VYTESQDGYIDRRDMRTGQMRSIRPEAKAGEPHYRFQWNSRWRFPHTSTLPFITAETFCLSRRTAETTDSLGAGLDHGRGPQQAPSFREDSG